MKKKIIKQLNILTILLMTISFSGCKVIDEIKKDLYVKISTGGAVGIGYLTATLLGEITDDGGKTITERGIIVFETNNAASTTQKIISGEGIGRFYGIFINLKALTQYTYKAYCVNAYGTANGEEKKFTTLDYSLPTLTMSSPNSIAYFGMTLNANVSNIGGTEILEKGFVYATSPNPTIINNKSIVTGFAGSAFATVLSNLIENTPYYIRAYATNLKGVSYSNEVLVKTLDTEAPKIQTSVYGATTSTIDAFASISNPNNIPTILSNGFYYSTMIGVKETDKFILSTSNTPTGFSGKIENILEGTVYYVRAFVKTSKGVTLGNEVQLTTSINPIRISLKAGLKVYYPFNGNANDESGNGFNGIASGVTLVADRKSNANSAYYFDGFAGKSIITNYYGISGNKSRSNVV